MKRIEARALWHTHRRASMDADDEEQREALQIGCILNRAPVVPETSANDRGFVASNGEPASVTAARLTAWDGALRAIEYDIKKVRFAVHQYCRDIA